MFKKGLRCLLRVNCEHYLTHTSHSESNVCGIITDKNKPIIIYEYFNHPKNVAVDKMHAHYGTARMTYNEKEGVIEGDYYSGRDRQTIGFMKFKRKLTKSSGSIIQFKEDNESSPV